MTRYLHRLDIVVPVARIAALATWWASEVAAGRLEYDDPTQWVPLSATGIAPATHRRSCGAYTEAQVRRIAARLLAVAGIGLPDDWDEYTRQQKRRWLIARRGDILNSLGVWVGADHNDGDWDDMRGSLAAMSLTPLVSGA